MNQNMDPADVLAAADALAAADESRTKMAERLYTPVWYHPLVGAAMSMFGLAAGLAAARRGWSDVLVMGGLFICVGIVLAYRRITGVALTGPIGPRSQRMLIVVGVVGILLMLAGLGLFSQVAVNWPWIVAYSLVVIVLITILGRRYDDILRDEIRSGAQL